MKRRSGQPAAFDRIAAIIAAFVILFLVVFLVVRNQPFADPMLAVLTRIVLSLAIAVLGATVPGFLNVSWRGGGAAIRAGGALALFVVSYVLTPQVFTTPFDPSRSAYDEGVRAYSIGQYNDVVDDMSKVPSNSSMYRSAADYMGNAEFQLGNYGRAVTYYERVIQASKTQREKLDGEFNIALMNMYSKNFAEAKKLLMPLLETPEMRDDRSVIFNAASALFNLGEVEHARQVFSKFPITARVPSDGDSRDLFAKAHWLAAEFLLSEKPLNCDKVRAEIATAKAIDPILQSEIANDHELAVCSEHQGGKKS